MSWKSVFRIAWREARASAVKFTFVVIAVAIGVGSLAGVRGFSRSFYTMLMREARTLLAADLSVRTFALPSVEQTALMDDLTRRGIAHTWITETISMASAGQGKPPLLVSIKAVEPGKYPFYGTVKMNPPQSLNELLKPDAIGVSDDLLLRLSVKVGDPVRIGGQEFRIAALVEEEPDRMAGSLNVGPRILMSRAALERANLIQTGSRAAERFLFRIPPPARVPNIRVELKKVFTEAMIADATEAHPLIADGLRQATTFLSLISLISLIVGALGVATAINAHLQQRMDTIAIMKCMGARSSQIIRIFVVQTLALGLCGGLLGLVLGVGVQLAFPFLISRYFPVHLGISFDPVPALQALSIGMLATLLFTVPPLLNIRRIRPGLIFRREMAETKPGWRERVKRSGPSVLAGAAIVIGIGAIAGALTSGTWRDALRLGEYFVGALVASLLALSFIAWLLLRALKMVGRRITRLPAVVRHGIANLYRPGNHAEAILVALGLGVMFTLTVYLIQHGLISDMFRAAPPGMPNVFLLDIAAKDQPAVIDLLRKQPGAERPPETMGTTAAKLITVNGTKLEDMKLQGFARRFRFTRQVTSLGEQPPYATVDSGKWWSGAGAGEARVCVSDDAARTLKISSGAELTFLMSGRTVKARVACVSKIDSIHLAGRLEFIFSPGVLDGLPVIYYGSIRMKPAEVSKLQMALYERFPTITVVNVADVLKIVQEVVDQISIVVRFISAFAILAGLIILASSVAGTRFRRVREVVILKTLGATRAKVASVFSMEFLILGLVAGVMGSVLASAFSSLVLERLLKANFHLSLIPNVVSILATAFVANAAGWLASWRILGQKPLQVLREE